MTANQLLFGLTITAVFSGVGGAMAGENCTCRYQGKDVLEGASICMQTPNGQQMAKCDRVLNNTAWKFTGQPCPFAQIQDRPEQMSPMIRVPAKAG